MAGDFAPQKFGSQDSEDGQERREHPRFAIRLRVMVAVGEAILPGRSEDLSKGGACLRLEEVLPEGTPIAVRFLTPYLEQFQYIDVNAMVQYAILTSDIPPWRLGVKIVGASPEAKRRIAKLIGE
jgi:hypothetical protein